ncbi:YhgE/Pip domain-containing protein [Candidatus Stoquefichus massiliensis]|uniref:YhgE/Pip domain-containing protein n=1 Tax=Candidatus Stoquefichus massiliensis TaxID=1470350 RepID=UPI000488EF94|nr:YhgE/Pip domain-containing protein [Candidatus Stoquefichus massiliensis]
MVKQEWKNVFHNAWIIVVMVAVIAIPSIYSCVFLGSMWDPYGNSGSIPVAVVNEDKEVSYNDSKLGVGEELVKNLQDNESMDFHFVNEKNAMDGLENGEYYMIITIPEDFSKNATTLLDNQPQKMIINYTTNPGTNYIASKMDDSAIAKIKAEVSSSVTKTYAQTIFDSIDVLSQGLGEASDGTGQLSDGVHQLIDGNKTISDNLKVLASSSLTFKDGADTLTHGLKDYTDGVVTVNNGVYTLKNGLNTLNQSTGALSQGVNDLNDGAVALKSGVNEYTNGVNQAYAGTQQLVSNSTKLVNGVNQLSTGTQQLVEGNQKVVDGVSKLSSTLSSSQEQLNKYQQLIAGLQKNGKGELAQKITSEGLKLNELDEGTKTLLTRFGITNDLPSSYQLIQQVSIGMNDLNIAINGGTLSNGDKTDGLVAGTKQVQAGLGQMNANISGGSYMTINQKGQPMNGNVDKKDSLLTGVQTYTAGVNQVNSGLSQLVDNNKKLKNGVSDLANGTGTLVSQTPTLVSGIKALDTGASQIYTGTSQLVSNNQTLLSGTSQLNGGAGQISNGAQQLSNGSMTLGNGLSEVNKGVTTLDTSLKDGAKQSQMNTNNSTFDMVAAPVDTTHNEISTVENNGHAMAPYMMSVALYVTALAFVLMYPIRHGIKNAENGWKYWLSKASVMYTISTVAAIVMITCLRMINGFEPQQLMMTYLFAILVSAAYMSIVMLLSMTTGYIGDFLLLVFMIVNLGGSAGTYPLETSGAFYKTIHAFMPYTYSVNGFRKVISMATASLTTEIWVFVGIFIVCSALTIVYFQVKNKEDKHLIPQAFENVNEEK